MHSLFPFLLLPLEIRTQIYQLTLVDIEPIEIEIDDVPLKVIPNCSAVVEAREITLSHGRDVMFDIGLNINISLLLVCRTAYEEAMPIIYGSNHFHFLIPWGRRSYSDEHAGCNTFMCFAARLGEQARSCIRTIGIEFPEVQRGEKGSEIKTKGEDELRVLQGFPALRNLKFHLDHVILSCDVRVLRQIHAAIPTTCRVHIQFKSGVADGRIEFRALRICDLAIKQMTEIWNWMLTGPREVVGEGHEFADERKWISWLEQRRINEEQAEAKQRAEVESDDNDAFKFDPFA
ncbi:MAG: hypothetical protein Q9169_006667 [Polycauliona sp. 2 TL-2023]